MTSLTDRLDHIRNNPRLQNQQQTAVILSAVEDTLKSQQSQFTPTAYFAALLSLLGQFIPSAAGNQVNKDVAGAVVYLLDLVTPHVPPPLLRSKFTQILTSLAPALVHTDADAPFLRSSIGCLVSLLVVQDGQAWALPQNQIGPRRAVAGLLALAMDHRPKVRKQAQAGLARILRNGPSSPSFDHPAADMCAETALHSFGDLASLSGQAKKRHSKAETSENDPGLIHALQLVKTIAAASSGWPSRSLDTLCEALFDIARSKNEYLTAAAFEVFESIFSGMSTDDSSTKLPRLLAAVIDLQPSRDDSQLLPPWIAIISRGYDVSAQLNPDETFHKLPELFTLVANFLSSSSYNIRVSASECLISFAVNCIPGRVILEPTVYDEKTLEKLGIIVLDLLSVKYQEAWMEVFVVIGAMLDTLKWRADPLFIRAVGIIGELRSNSSFTGKQQADEVISKAIRAIGPRRVLEIMPLNLLKTSPGKPGRAWLLPIVRDSVSNTSLTHFRNELLPLSEALYQRVLDHGDKVKTMEIKAYETLVQQIWTALPGYCNCPLDVVEAFNQDFAELIAKVLYQQPEMRVVLCRALQTLVDSTKSIAMSQESEDLIAQGRISKVEAKRSITHLTTLSPNLLAVLFNIYNETVPQYRGTILACIDSFLSITEPKDISETFARVTSYLDVAIQESKLPPKPASRLKDQKETAPPPPLSHALMDIIVTIAMYIPRDGYAALFSMAASIIIGQHDVQLQKKAYKLIPRLALSPIGQIALQARNSDLRQMMLDSAASVAVHARKDRLAALAGVIDTLVPEDLYFIPCVLPEVILCTKETNEKARQTAFDVLVQMGDKMKAGGVIDNSRVSHMPEGTPSVPASLEEYFTMLSAGLAGSTPHMISASVTAITRAIYEFRSELKEEALVDMVETMDLFLKSPSREIVRSVLGFVKVCVISFHSSLVQPRLSTLVPALLKWGHEHKNQFKAKVKHILERIIRRFGVELVDRYCPDEDKKLVANIRKTRERRKRRKEACDGDDGEVEGKEAASGPRRKPRFESEFDEAIYGSDSSSSGADSEDEKNATTTHEHGRKGRGQTYIVEDDDEPLDLLSKQALANISSTRPRRSAKSEIGSKRRNEQLRTNEDGKLVFREAEDDDDDMIDVAGEPGDGSLHGGINAYVDAIRGRHSAQRGQRGRLKFSNKREKGRVEEGQDPERVAPTSNDSHSGRSRDPSSNGGRHTERSRGRGGGRSGFHESGSNGGRGSGSNRGRGGSLARRGGRGSSSSRGDSGAAKQRHSLGGGKTRGGRIEKKSFSKRR